MKIGISALPYAYGKERYKKLREAGFDCHDFQLANTTVEPYTLDDEGFRAYAEEERRLAEEAGIRINQMHGPWQWPLHDATEEERAERMEKMKRSVLAASIMGADYLIIHPLMPHGIKERADERLSAETFDINVTFLRELAEYALALGVTVCLENMPFPDFSITTPADVVRVIDAVGSEGLKMCLDTGHACMFPDWQPGKTVRTYPEYIRTLHVHDNDGKNDSHFMPYYRGVIDWQDFTAALAEVGFDGTLSLECAPPWKMPKAPYDKFIAAYAALANSIAGNED